MCGIAAYAGPKPAAPFISDALTKLEYRGYDSWGMAVADGYNMDRIRRLGAPSEGRDGLPDLWATAKVGIGHTRWATHGEVSLCNAHPVAGGVSPLNRSCYVVHNGVVENHNELRQKLTGDGYTFNTQTDTEVIAHLLDQSLSKADPMLALRDVCERLEGVYAFAAVSRKAPGVLMLASSGSPLLLTRDGHVASDAAAFVGHAQECRRMRRGQVALVVECLGAAHIVLADTSNISRPVPFESLERAEVPAAVDTKHGPYRHHMLKEIHEQPGALRAFRTWVNCGMPKPPQVVLFGCGSSYNACLMSRPLFEVWAGVQTTVEYASEFSHRAADLYPPGTLFVAATQSGETRDTLAAMESLQRRREDVLVVTNVPGSSATQLAGRTVHLGAGPELGVAATKTFTATVAALAEAASLWSDAAGSGWVYYRELCQELPALLTGMLSDDYAGGVAALAEHVECFDRALYLGRGLNYAAAREGALKLKEVSYIHAEAMPAAEMKHGPIALIDSRTLSVFLLTDDGSGRAEDIQKVVSNLHEVRTRNGAVLAITDANARWRLSERDYDWEIRLPDAIVSPLAKTLMVNVILQLLAYHTAVRMGRNVDQPRNLAKSVTV